MGKQRTISYFFAPKNEKISDSASYKDASSTAKRKRSPESFDQSKKKANFAERGEDSASPPHSIAETSNLELTESLSNSKLPIGLSEFEAAGPRQGSEPKTGSVVLPSSDPALHRKFVNKLLSKYDESGKLQEAKSEKREKYTPLEEQVLELKSRYYGVLLMVEVGYKFRFFGEDAEIAAKELGIYAHYDHNFLTASIPTFRLHVHVRRLVEAGYKVGVVKQTETAALKAHGLNKSAPFTRSLSAIYTKATLEAAEALGGEAQDLGNSRIGTYLMCVVDDENFPKNTKKGNSRMGNSKGSVGLSETGDAMVGFVAVDPSTGDVMYGHFRDSITRAELQSCLLKISPVELLLGRPLSSPTEQLLIDFAGPSSNVRLEHASRDCFKDGGALAEVMSFYASGDEEMSEESVGDAKFEKDEKGIQAVMAMPDLVVQALALSLQHLKQFKLERILRLGATFHEFLSKTEMSLTSNTLQQLELLKNKIDGSENGSLLKLMDHTYTAFGGRLLKHWVSHPLCDRNMIRDRLDAVSEIVNSMGTTMGNGHQSTCSGTDITEYVGAAGQHVIVGGELQSLLASVLSSLGKLADIERGITRIFHRTATTAEFVSVIHALLTAATQLKQLEVVGYARSSVDEDSSHHPYRVKAHLLSQLISVASSSCVIENATRFLSSINKDAAIKGDKQNIFFCAGNRFSEVSKCHSIVKASEEDLESLLPVFRRELKLTNLEYSTVSGLTHLLEVPSAMRVPSNWIKVNSTKKLTRYQPPEVIRALDKLAVAKEQLAIACSKAWDSFLAEFASVYTYFRSAVQALATLDCLHSLALLSRNQGYMQPILLEEQEPPQLHIKAGRHPVLESVLRESFVDNDTQLDSTGEYCQIITGPNMGGKSCYIRQVALIVIMAQVGSFVPAKSMKLHVFDSVFTRMGASDSIQHSSSTFFEELSETSTLLSNSTSRSLVILDELGRGTSTHDGAAIAYATLHFLLKVKCCMTLFVTHYPKLAELKNEFPGKVNLYYVSYLAEECHTHRSAGCELMSTPTWQNSSVTANDVSQKITFLYKLLPGLVNRSFGLHVARLAQLPDSCISQAAIMSARFENDVCNRLQAKPRTKFSPMNLTNSYSDQNDENLDEAEINNLKAELEKWLTHDRSQFSHILALLKSACKKTNPQEGLHVLHTAQQLARQILVPESTSSEARRQS